jgi:GNAT superfamily N-acetyltransferase
VFAHGDVAWLGMAATLPEARGRGSQSAILARRIERAAELGCSVVATETGARTSDRPSGSYRNILRAGFEEAYLRPNFASPR